MSAIKPDEIQEVSVHAVDMYIERIFGIRKETAGDSIRDSARAKIEAAVLDPEIIYNEEKDEGGCPIHIRGEIAIPVRPAEEAPGKVVVPTTYPKETYI